MIDPQSVISYGKDLFGLLNFIKGIVGSEVISAYCRWDATKVEGSNKIDVQRIETEAKEVFWFNVTPIDNYVFVHFPLNGNGCEEIIGTIDNNPLADPNYWRWVQQSKSGTIVSGDYVPPNAKVDFVVVGYKPKAITRHLSNVA